MLWKSPQWPHPPTNGQPATARPSLPEKDKGAVPPNDSSLSTQPQGPQTARGEAAASGTSCTGAMALRCFEEALTAYEKLEIREFDAIYYAGQNCEGKIRAPVATEINFGYDDERGDYRVKWRDHFNYRYEALASLGKGSFGQVIKALDHKCNSLVAVKIIRNKKRFHQQAKVEIAILEHLRTRDPDGKYGIIRLLETFVFRNHVCLTYELLSINLYEYMKLNKFHPMPLPVVKKIGASLLISLAFMWREGIIHCDVKPENIMLRQINRTGVKLIDLGSACFETERCYTYIQSRFYRAPEIILNLGYSRKIDLWSYACVLCELASGYPLFPGENEVEQLACIMEFLGLPPDHIISKSPRASHFFEQEDSVYYPKLVPNSRKKIREPSTKTLGGFLGLEENHEFVEFVKMFLRWDPDERPNPEPAMRHPWICDAYVGLTPRVPVPPVSARKQPPREGRSDHVPTLPDIPQKQKRA